MKLEIDTKGKTLGSWLYGLVATLTFIWLEITTLADEWNEAATLRDFIVDQFWDHIFGLEAIVNGFWAALWPLYWLSQLG